MRVMQRELGNKNLMRCIKKEFSMKNVNRKTRRLKEEPTGNLCQTKIVEFLKEGS